MSSYLVRLLVHGDEPLIETFTNNIGRHRCMFVLNNLILTNNCLVTNELLNSGWLPSTYGEGDYYGVFQKQSSPENVLVGLVAHFWNNNIVVHLPSIADNMNHPLILDALYSRLESRNRIIEGVLGNDSEASMVVFYLLSKIPALQASFTMGPQSKDFFMEMSYRRQIEVSSISEEPLFPTVAKANHLQTIVSSMPSTWKVVAPREIARDILEEWLIAFSVESLGATSPNVERIRSRIDMYNIYNPSNSSSTDTSNSTENETRPSAWILVNEENVPVSLVGISCRIPDTIQIGPVYTPPPHRQHRYATNLLAAVLHKEYTHKWSHQAVLMANDEYAMRCYQNVGFIVTGEFRLALFDEPVSLPQAVETDSL